MIVDSIGGDITNDDFKGIHATAQERSERYLDKKLEKLLTDEQKTAEKDARKAAKDAGKTPAESRKAVDEALKLTDDQKAKMKDLQKQNTELNRKIVDALKK